MWRTVLNLEWRILRKDKAALGIILLFALFVVAAAIAGGRQADSVKEGLERTKAAEGAQMVSIDSPVATPGRTPTGRPLPTRHRRRLLQILAATKVRFEPACALAYHTLEPTRGTCLRQQSSEL